MQYFIMKMSNTQQRKQIASQNSSDIDFNNLYEKCTAKSYYFLIIDNTLASDNPSRFRKNLIKRT